MAKMSIGAAFSETFAFLGANWARMLLYLGGALVAIALLGWLLIGSTFTSMMASPNDPSAVLGAFGKIFFFAIIAGAVMFAASLLVWRSGLVGGDPAADIGWSLGAGAAYVGAMFVLYIGAVIAMYIVILIVGLFAVALFGVSGLSPEIFMSGGVSGGLIAFGIIVYIAIIVFFLWLFGRLGVAGPWMAAQRRSNPFAALGASWKLTSASQWTIVGFNLIIMILSFVFLMVANMIFGGIVGAAGGVVGAMGSPGAGAGTILFAVVFGLLIYVPLVLLSVSTPAAIYRCINTDSNADVFT